ncbi:hypothetical protein BH10PSE10_BH10PSE10_02870 [soil metagenome]
MASKSESEFLTAAQVRQRYGDASRMWLHRRITRDEFPKPITFGGRNRFFKVSELEEWERRMIQRGIAAPPPASPKAKR